MSLRSPRGPFATDAEARAAIRFGEAFGYAGRHATLLDACEDAGVKLGAFDERIIGWLARWDPETVAVVAGLVDRAHAGALAHAELAGALDDGEAGEAGPVVDGGAEAGGPFLVRLADAVYEGLCGRGGLSLEAVRSALADAFIETGDVR